MQAMRTGIVFSKNIVYENILKNITIYVIFNIYHTDFSNILYEIFFENNLLFVFLCAFTLKKFKKLRKRESKIRMVRFGWKKILLTYNRIWSYSFFRSYHHYKITSRTILKNIYTLFKIVKLLIIN